MESGISPRTMTTKKKSCGKSELKIWINHINQKMSIFLDLTLRNSVGRDRDCNGNTEILKASVPKPKTNRNFRPH